MFFWIKRRTTKLSRTPKVMLDEEADKIAPPTETQITVATVLLTLLYWQATAIAPGVEGMLLSNWMTCFNRKDFITQQEGSMNCLISLTEENQRDWKGFCCLQGPRSWLCQLWGVNNMIAGISQFLSNIFPIISWIPHQCTPLQEEVIYFSTLTKVWQATWTKLKLPDSEI